MGKQIGQLRKVTPLLPVNPATENIELTVPVRRHVDDTREVLAPSHIDARIGDLATGSRDPTSERLSRFNPRAPSTTFAPRSASMTAVASPIALPARECFRSSRR